MISLQDCHIITTRRRAYDCYTVHKHIVNHFILIPALICKSERKPIKKKLIQRIYCLSIIIIVKQNHTLHIYDDDNNYAILLLPICVAGVFRYIYDVCLLLY